MGAGRIAAYVVIAIIVVSGGIWVFSALPQAPVGQAATMVIDFSAVDKIAGGADAATSAVSIYKLIDGAYDLSETVTISGAATASTLTYTTGATLFLKMFDASDTSICTQYLTWTVPLADPSEIYGQAFQVALSFTDKGDTAKDISIIESNGTALANSAKVNTSESGYDTAYATWEFNLRAMDDNSGYVNTDNFLKGYSNDHYLILSATGTGWDSTVLLSISGWQIFEKASVRYFVYKLSDSDLTRKLLSDGSYDPAGRFTLSATFDLIGITSGDSVTLAYEYRWYSSVEHFIAASNWGSDSAATSESITILPT